MTLKASHLSKHFAANTILHDISLEVSAGETIAIIGKSGEGKTTLLHILGTLEEPSSGTLEICGQIATIKENNCLRNQHIGFVFQAYHLLEELSVLENILMPARIGKQKMDLAHKRALELLKEVDLLHRASLPAKLLSGGEKQRVAVARALINDPALILADEPSGNLDHASSQAIYTLLLESAQKRGKALIVVTHDLELASMCQRTYALQDGRLT
jgi:lipoprotein-releasing system ATP-binding protein